MTALTNPITFNNASGSDTAASGSGPATAVSGTGASSTASSATVDLSADTPDLSGVSAGDLFWIDSSSGRQFSVISSVNDGADTVTCDDTFDNTESGRNWGIGGVRATLDNTNSRKLFSADYLAGWRVQLASNQTLTGSALTLVTGCPINIESDTPKTLRTITQSANAACFYTTDNDQNTITLKDIKCENSNATKTAAFALDPTNGAVFHAIRCVFGDATNQLLSATDTATNITFTECDITDCTSDGIRCTSRRLILKHCNIVNNGGRGINSNNTTASIIGCIIADNTSDGFYGRADDLQMFLHNVVDDNGGDGLDLTLVTQSPVGLIENNIITNNAGYGVRGSGTEQGTSECLRHNNFGTGASANTLGDVLTLAKGEGNVNLDPQFTDAANDDYSTGANMKDAATPVGGTDPVGLNSSTYAYLDIGIQQECSGGGGGGGGLLRVGMSGGIFG